MPPLTWQQVSAPSFSGVAESQRLSADLLSKGFGSAIDAVGTFKEGQKSAANGELLSRIAAYGNPEELRAGLASGAVFEGLDRSYITAETMDRANAHTAALLSDTKTGVMTEGERIKNVGYGKDNLQKDAVTAGQYQLNAGYGLDNDGKRISNAQDQTNLDQDQNDYAVTESVRTAKPVADEIYFRAQDLAYSGNPAAAMSTLRSNVDALVAGGYDGEALLKSITDLSTTQASGVGNREVVYQGGLTTDTRQIEQQATDHFNALATSTTYRDAQQAADNLNLTPEVRVALSKMITEGEKSFRDPNSSDADYRDDPSYDPSVAGKLGGDGDQVQRLINSAKPLDATQLGAVDFYAQTQKDQADRAEEALMTSQSFSNYNVAKGLLNPDLQNVSTEDALRETLVGLETAHPDLKPKELRQNLETIEDNYGLNSGQAMWLIENSIGRENWMLALVQGEENVDYNAINTFLAQVGTYDQNTKKWDLTGLKEIVAQGSRSAQAVEKLNAAEAAVTEARAAYDFYYRANAQGSTQDKQDKLARADKQLKEAVKRMDDAVERVQPR
jgi:hypothetical protein